ncbi:flagellar basal body protein [Roseomonas sp. CAU 1739]|uniref:flagellar basal body rod protein FlgB n=1 Tax=Roseomonas sp. CAU 1739 TaxID=3140364 RepID=UPI00325C170C
MDPTRTGPIALAEARLHWLDARQRVLSQNVANADTPGFRPSDMQPFAQALAGVQGAVARTDPRHLAPARDARAQRERRVERSMDGNGVALDREAMRIADTETAHALAVGLHRRYLGLFRTALGRNQ